MLLVLLDAELHQQGFKGLEQPQTGADGGACCAGFLCSAEMLGNARELFPAQTMMAHSTIRAESVSSCSSTARSRMV